MFEYCIPKWTPDDGHLDADKAIEIIRKAMADHQHCFTVPPSRLRLTPEIEQEIRDGFANMGDFKFFAVPVLSKDRKEAPLG